MNISYTSEISQPPEVVFPWIAEPEKSMQWQKSVTRAELVTKRPEVVGTTFRETVREGGNALVMNGVITRFQPNESIAFHLSSRIHEFDVTYALEGTADKTLFSVEASVRWKFPMNVIAFFYGKQMQERLVTQLMLETAELKRICERG